jgi:hypothetical protein
VGERRKGERRKKLSRGREERIEKS